LRFIFLELGDELDCTLENASLVLFATRYDFSELVNTLVDRFTAATFDCVAYQQMVDDVDSVMLCNDDLPSL
jgi:hypothetical protein